MIFFPLFLFQCWGIRGGVVVLEGISRAPLMGIHYVVEVSDRFLIRESMGYWQKEYKEVNGTRTKDCTFSSLSFTETGFLRAKKGKMELEVGPGIGIHLLKNRVKEKNEYGEWTITEYYYLNSNPIGLHMEGEVLFNLTRFCLSGGMKIGVIFLSPREENLFYTRGNLIETIYSVSISF